MNTEMNLYPAGSIEYTFKMYITYDRRISCSVLHPNVREVILEKLKLSDVYDPAWRMIINTGPIQSIEEVDDIGNSIKEEIFDSLAFILNTSIAEIRQTGHGLTPRPEEGGILHCIMPTGTISIAAANGCNSMSDDSAQEVQVALSKVSGSKINHRIGLFRHAIGIEEPVVQFLMLYLILYDLCKNQMEVDKRILSIAPDTPETRYTKNGMPKTYQETTYTRLRNEIAHRPSNLERTRNEIINNRDRFRSIVYKILQSAM